MVFTLHYGKIEIGSRNSLKLISLVLLFMVIPMLSNAQHPIGNNEVNEKVDSAFEALYNFQFKKAHNFVSRNIEENNNAWHYFTISNIQLWEMFAGTSDGDLKKSYRETLKEQFHLCGQLSNENESRFLRIMYYTYQTRSTLHESDYLPAFRSINNYYDLLKPTFKDTTYTPYLLVDGLYFYLFDYAHNEYILLRPFLKFYKKGDAQKGLRYLNKATNSKNEIISTEARYFLMKIWFDLENNPKKALPYARELHNNYPGNFIFDLYYRKIRKSLDPNYSPDLKKIKAKILENSELNNQQVKHFEYLLNNNYPTG